VLGHVAGELRDLDVAPQVALEAGEQDLALARLEAVDDRGDGALEVGAREEDELLLFVCLLGCFVGLFFLLFVVVFCEFWFVFSPRARASFFFCVRRLFVSVVFARKQKQRQQTKPLPFSPCAQSPGTR
jgi:hypothetical protein